MTQAKKFKRQVRERMAKTGESYETARRHFGRFEGIVRETIRLAKAAQDERRRAPPARTPGEMVARMRLPAPERQALQVHLRRLKEEDLLKLRTLMHAGRGDVDPRELHHALTMRREKRSNAEITTISKGRLVDRLTAGLALAKRLGVDLDARWDAARASQAENEVGLLKVRPFVKQLPWGGNEASLEISGSIEGGSFVVLVLDQVVELRTARLGVDRWGEYALVEESTYAMHGGLILKAEPEYDPDEGDGACIGVALHGNARAEEELLVRRAGIDPASVHVISPPVASLSVYFDAGGRMNGSTTVGAGTTLPRPMPN